MSITSNRAADGAGIYASSASLTMHGSMEVSGNMATGYLGGGGMFLLQSMMLVPAVEQAQIMLFQANKAKSGMSSSIESVSVSVRYVSACTPCCCLYIVMCVCTSSHGHGEILYLNDQS